MIGAASSRSFIASAMLSRRQSVAIFPNHAHLTKLLTRVFVAQLKERNGSSRQALKKFVKANNSITVTEKMFDSLFNKALKSGVEKGVFEQPKGMSPIAHLIDCTFFLTCHRTLWPCEVGQEGQGDQACC